jgi:hypothetical protein
MNVVYILRIHEGENMPGIEIKPILNYIIDWVQARLNERTSWDGVTIIVISIIALIATPLVKYAGWIGLGYGIWTLWKREKVQ